MTRLRSIILKVAGRCNIRCRYCYMYELVDQTWRTQPKVMSDATLQASFAWLTSYLMLPDVPAFHVSLHGGEPLTCGLDYVARIADLRDQARLRVGKPITMSLVTNGTLLTDAWLELFAERRINFGISIDGPAEWHDRNRITATGLGTHAQVEAALRRALQSRAAPRFSGVLCVVHPDMDGRKLVRYFYDLGVQKFDLLLPDQNYDNTTPHYPRPTRANYGDVLVAAYREWRAIDDPSFVIRKFRLILAAMLGHVPVLDSLGTGPITVFTVESSGEIEPVDTMKACGNGYTKSGYHISQVVGSELENIAQIALGLNKHVVMASECASCRHGASCGGGYLPHRFRQGTFSNPTVYCADMMAIGDEICRDLKDTIGRARSSVRQNQ